MLNFISSLWRSFEIWIISGNVLVKPSVSGHVQILLSIISSISCKIQLEMLTFHSWSKLFYFQVHFHLKQANFEVPICFFSSFAQVGLQFSRSVVSDSDPMNRNTPGLPVHHQLPEFTQTHVHWVGGAIQPSHPLSSPSPPALSPSQHQGLFQWVSSLHEVAKVLEFQLQHQSFQWTPRTDLL